LGHPTGKWQEGKEMLLLSSLVGQIHQRLFEKEKDHEGPENQ